MLYIEESKKNDILVMCSDGLTNMVSDEEIYNIAKGDEIMNKNILDFAKFLDEQNIPVWIRHVLVPGYTDDTKHLQDLRAFIDTLSNVQKVEVLPYHTLGVSKYENLGITYPLAGVPTPTKKQMDILLF